MSHLPYLFKSQTAPSTPYPGQYWEQTTADNNVIGQWVWYSTISAWVSSQIIYRAIPICFTQGVLLGGVIGLIDSTTSDCPICTGNTYSIYLRSLTVAFMTAGNLTGSNYWRFNFKSSGSVVQSINVTSSNTGTTTGNIQKTLNNINTVYAHNGIYAVNFQKIGSAPDISMLTAFMECQAVKP